MQQDAALTVKGKRPDHHPCAVITRKGKTWGFGRKPSPTSTTERRHPKKDKDQDIALYARSWAVLRAILEEQPLGQTRRGHIRSDQDITLRYNYSTTEKVIEHEFKQFPPKQESADRKGYRVIRRSPLRRWDSKACLKGGKKTSKIYDGRQHINHRKKKPGLLE